MRLEIREFQILYASEILACLVLSLRSKWPAAFLMPYWVVTWIVFAAVTLMPHLCASLSLDIFGF